MHTAQATTLQPNAAPAVCTRHAAAEWAVSHRALLAPQDELLLPLQRGVVTQYARAETGATRLRLLCGDQEVSFDEPEFFAFGATLALQSRFTAGSATAWGSGYAWPQVQPLLAELLAAGVLQRATSGVAEGVQAPLLTGPRPAPLPAGPCATPRMWTEGEALMHSLTGRPLELGWLELVLPIFRVAHTALDSDGRQVGEANVFPKALRLDVPTAWRACIYPGTRFQVERPMNVTALKAMRLHWLPMMALVSQVRGAYLQRFPQARAGWTVGHVERMATCVLALPTYQLMRAVNPVPNGDLHPALSSVFRVTDGLRMVMHQMLFVPIAEPTLQPDTPITRAEIAAYAERNHSFHSEHGVCAGPQVMVDEFLAVLLDGAAVRGAEQAPSDPALQQAQADIEPALDYALLGLQVHATVFTLWPVMARAYERLAEISAAWGQHAGPAVAELAARLAATVAGLHSGTYLATEAWRAEREAVYADMYAHCAQGLASDETDLPGQIAPMLSCAHAQADRTLETRLQQRYGQPDRSDRADVRALRNALMDFLLQLQAILRVAAEAQARLNRHLGRSAPLCAFTSDDLNLHNSLQGATPPRMPYLVHEIEAWLQLRLVVDAEVITITVPVTVDGDHTAFDAQAPACHHPDTPGMVPGVAHANRVQTK